MSQKKTTEQFIDEAKAIHGNKYDYSKVLYKSNNEKVCIICPEHGEFLQTAKIHLQGIGCRLCSFNVRNKKQTKDKEFFLQKAKNIHGELYNYSKINYINTKTKICIICPKHGEFWQLPSSHLRGFGCKKCANEINGKKSALTKDLFVNKATIVHQNKYDYSKVEYINNRTKVEIICPIHGSFFQIPNNHLNGAGCPICGMEKTREAGKGVRFNTRKKVAGIGINNYNGVIKYEVLRIYHIWRAMIKRCYVDIEKNPTYKDCSICAEWFYFNNFYEWYVDNYKEGFALDKDILVQGNKIYSPQTCCFVPVEINNLFNTHGKHRKKNPKCGIYFRDNRYIAVTSMYGKNVNLGGYSTLEEAQEVYKKNKESYIKEVAEKWKDKIEQNVYEALMRYEYKFD